MARKKTGATRRISPPKTEIGARLLALLAEEGAFARADGERIIVFAPRRGITLQIGSCPARDAAALVTAGAAEWLGAARQRLALTAAGMAHARRMAAPAEIAFRIQHGEVTATGEADAPLVDLKESPLVWLYRRKDRAGVAWLGDAEFAAGERLRSDLTAAAMMPRMSVQWDAAPAAGRGAGLTIGEAALAARQRVHKALAAVGPEMAGVLVDICGFLKGIDLVERERGWPVRSAKVVLLLALQRLARHYGYGNAATGIARRGRQHVWGAEDYRPAFVTPEAGPAPAAHPP